MLVERMRELHARRHDDGRRARAGEAQRRVHDPHAGQCRQRALRVEPGAQAGRAARRPTPASTSSASSSWRRGTDNDRRPVRHDGVLAARDERLQRGLEAARRDGQRDVDRPRSTKPILGVTNGVHPPSWVGGPFRQLYESIGGDLDNLDPQPKAFLTQGRQAARRRDLGGASPPEARARVLLAAPTAAADGTPRRGADRARGAGRRARSRGADDRLRAPVCDVQARRAAVQRRGAPGAHPAQRGAAGPDRLRRQGPPGRPTRPARDPGHLRAQPLAQVREARLRRRGLRHPRRPLPRPGRRRVAQQPAPSARGVGHERHEGRNERDHQLLRARRLVGRGLQRGERLGHRRPRVELRTRALRTGPTLRICIGCSKTRSCRCITSATGRACRSAGCR